MIDLEMILEEARREVTKFAKDTGILTDWEVAQEDPRLLSSGEMSKVSFNCKFNANKCKVMFMANTKLYFPIHNNGL